MHGLDNLKYQKLSDGLEYAVIPYDQTFKNKRHEDWVQDSIQDFFKPNPETNIDGDVVFLHSMPSIEGNYRNESMVKVGNELLEISEDQPVLVPIITATYVSDEGESPQQLYGIVRTHISNGDNPPSLEQVKINGKPIIIPNNEMNFKNYEIETPVYGIFLPDPSDGPSRKTQVEYPIPSEVVGYIPGVTRGYFVMLALKPSQKNYYFIECHSRGMTNEKGPYNSSLFYQIKVNPKVNNDKKQPPPKANPLPDSLSRNIGIKVIEKHKKGEVTDDEKNEIMKYLNSTKNEQSNQDQSQTSSGSGESKNPN